MPQKPRFCAPTVSSGDWTAELRPTPITPDIHLVNSQRHPRTQNGEESNLMHGEALEVERKGERPRDVASTSSACLSSPRSFANLFSSLFHSACIRVVSPPTTLVSSPYTWNTPNTSPSPRKPHLAPAESFILWFVCVPIEKHPPRPHSTLNLLETPTQFGTRTSLPYNARRANFANYTAAHFIEKFILGIYEPSASFFHSPTFRPFFASHHHPYTIIVANMDPLLTRCSSLAIAISFAHDPPTVTCRAACPPYILPPSSSLLHGHFNSPGSHSHSATRPPSLDMLEAVTMSTRIALLLPTL
ncbi:hypothetical protein C8R44DRAFT_888777 [Mycena epipterygia]|nr:hypothetical protein C8R44DRAFT_888777 [Mycena epipterygia]